MHLLNIKRLHPPNFLTSHKHITISKQTGIVLCVDFPGFLDFGKRGLDLFLASEFGFKLWVSRYMNLVKFQLKKLPHPNTTTITSDNPRQGVIKVGNSAYLLRHVLEDFFKRG